MEKKPKNPNLKKLLSAMGGYAEKLRECQAELLHLIGFDDEIRFDGDVISRHEVESWSETLEKIDKTTRYV